MTTKAAPPPANLSKQEPTNSSSSAPSFPARVWEWIWGARAMADLRSRKRPRSQRAAELQRRAQLAIELGNHAIMPSQPLQHGPAFDIACELYREGIHWALSARRAWYAPTPSAGDKSATSSSAGDVASQTGDGVASEGLEGCPPSDDATTSDGEERAATIGEARNAGDCQEMAVHPAASVPWDDDDRAFIVRAIGRDGAADTVRPLIEKQSFVDFAELPPKQQRQLAERLRQTAEELVDHLDPARGELEGIWLRRLAFVVVTVVAIVAVTTTAIQIRDRREAASNVANGKPWTASSRYPEFGCRSPLQHCSDSPDYFFHTNEEQDPWLEIDLESPQTISGVRVTGRPDCCNDRVVPLVVEVSADREHWSEVARRTTEFKVWKTSFAPVTARWVKLHAPRRTMLHFREVRVLR